jgi:hypothetical protein
LDNRAALLPVFARCALVKPCDPPRCGPVTTLAQHLS